MNEFARNIMIKPEHLALLKKICNSAVPGRTVWAYGSRVKGTARERSDLDLVVIDAHRDDVISLKEIFDESDLPFIVDVMDWNLIPDHFRENILGAYFVIQSADETGSC
jgi:predicted nucleotidyltransferase